MTDHILGVDISKANLDVHLIPTDETQQFANSTVGFRRLIAWLRERPVSRVSGSVKSSMNGISRCPLK